MHVHGANTPFGCLAIFNGPEYCSSIRPLADDVSIGKMENMPDPSPHYLGQLRSFAVVLRQVNILWDVKCRFSGAEPGIGTEGAGSVPQKEENNMLFKAKKNQETSRATLAKNQNESHRSFW